jgi:hypothetical protein
VFELTVVVASAWALVLGCTTLGGSSSSSGDSDSPSQTDPPPLPPPDLEPGPNGVAGSDGDAGTDADSSFDAALDAPELRDAGEAGTDAAVCIPEVDSGSVHRLRPGCPGEKPRASKCDLEGLRCLYESDAGEGCYDEWTCLFGLWSPLGDRCPTEAAVPDNAAGCPAKAPVDGEPCENEGLECGFAACTDDTAGVRAVCFCGRFRVESLGCPSGSK